MSDKPPVAYVRAQNVAAPTTDELFDLLLILQSNPGGAPGSHPNGAISTQQFAILPAHLKKLFTPKVNR